MRRGLHLRIDRRARAADRLARAHGMRVVHRATEPFLMRGRPPREAYLLDVEGHKQDLLRRLAPVRPIPELRVSDWIFSLSTGSIRSRGAETCRFPFDAILAEVL